jgi:hypothetical protein
MLQVMQFASATRNMGFCGPLRGLCGPLRGRFFVLPFFTHDLTMIHLPVPSSTSVLAPFTHALTMVPLPVPSSTSVLLAFTHALTHHGMP